MPDVDTKRSQRLAQAHLKVRLLRKRYGTGHAKVMAAMIDALELERPGSMDEMFAECGLSLPAATYCTDEGAPAFSIQQIAEVVGTSQHDVIERAKAMADELGKPVFIYAANHIQ